MKYLGTITDDNDIATKEYVDNAVASGGGGGGLTKAEIVDFIYPVGSLFISTTSANPSTYLDGTWTQIKDKFLLSAGDTYTAGSTGGSADAVVVSHNHSASTASAGSHSHTFKYRNNMGTGSATGSPHSASYTSGTGDIETNSTGAHTHTVTVSSNGVSGTGKNMPPYLAVYVWKRTA
jgi:hypothetical protein